MTRSDLALRAATCALLLAATGCVTQAPPANPQVAEAAEPAALPRPVTPVTPAASPPQVSAVTSDARPLEIARAEFVRDTATRFAIDPAYIESVLAGAEIREGIVNAMSRPAEAKPWRDYRPIFISDARISGGRAFLAEHRDALARVEAKYGVPAEMIVSIIGVETSYGGNTGSYRVVDALYTLAFAYPRTNEPGKIERENRREAFFRDELAQLFALGKETGIDITSLKGSYAGAMGWGQFMPSSYRDYAVDGNGDGKRDLFNSTDDVFSSIANYFVKKGGWQRGEPVTVRATRAPGAADYEPEGLEPNATLAELGARGYHPADQVSGVDRALLLNLDGAAGKEHWLGFQNFYAITRYNISKHYAMAVHQLAEAIAGRSISDAPPLAGSDAAGQPGA
ncbi:MAG: lytic murein transglycosylase B [Pseudomonadota bacterium]|nr:lytic murein transglycosylase B [Pseudomonadota bacterium]